MFAMSSSFVLLFLLLLLLSSSSLTSILGLFAPSSSPPSWSRRNIDGVGRRATGCDRRFIAMPILSGSISKWNENDDDPPNEDAPPGGDGDDDVKFPVQKARRKKRGSTGGGGGGERRSPRFDDDDRDSLPFVVAESIPDPYTPPDEMVRAARKNSDADAIILRRNNNRRRRNNAATTMNNDGIGIGSSISATVKSIRSDGTLKRVLGEFVFDSNTNCGDLLHISDREYEVLSSRSQFRYAGGRKFVLVRKVLEVKEISRIAEEASLRRLMDKVDVSATGKNFE